MRELFNKAGLNGFDAIIVLLHTLRSLAPNRLIHILPTLQPLWQLWHLPIS